MMLCYMTGDELDTLKQNIYFAIMSSGHDISCHHHDMPDIIMTCHVNISTFEGVALLALPHKRPSAAPPPALVLHRGALRLVLEDGVEGVAVTAVLQ